MPAPFSAVHIPFISGARQDIGKIAQESPSQLRRAQNVMFTKRGHITGRPALVSRDAPVEVGGAGSSLLSSLTSAVIGAVPSGIVSTGFSTSSGGDTPLACWQGQSYYNRNSLWVAAGSHWSLRQTKSAILKTIDPVNGQRTNPAPVGMSIVGIPTTGSSGTGFPFLNSEGEVDSISLGPLTNFVQADGNHSVAGNAVFFIDNSTGTVYGHIPGNPPTVTQVVLAANGIIVFAGGQQQATSAVLANDGFYYLAFKTTTAGRIDILRINPVGTVTQTLSLTGLGTVQGLGVVHNGLNGLGLAWNDTASTSLKTKIITITAGVMTDSGLNVTLTGTALNLSGGDVGTLAVGLSHNGLMSVLFTLNTGSMYLGGRSFSAAVETANTSLVANGLAQGREWDPLFGGVVVAGHTLVGVMNSFDLFNQSSQWIVLDCTKLYGSSNTTDRTVVAAGPYLGAARIAPASVYSTANSVSFGVAEGIQFSGAERPVSIVRRAGIRRITLSTQGTQATHVNGVTLLSGQIPFVFDGSVIRPDHFAEEMPFIFNSTAASAGGSLPAGSFTYQVTWESVNSRGQVTRSGASNQQTVSVTLNQKVTVVVTKPQLWNSPSQLEFVRIRLWATQVNPTNNALLYFVTEAVDTTPSTGTPVSLIHTTQAVGTEERLYETSDTLSDMRAPGADRGIAVVAERAWVADQTTLYASKLIRPGIAVAWNSEGPNSLTLPASLGTIQGLASVNQGLVVLCSRGAAVVTGPGTDDTGAGPGWVLQIIDGVPGMGISSPRSLATTPAGVAFQAQDGDLWMANSSGQALPMSRALRDSATNTLVDVVNLVSTTRTNLMLLSQGAAGVLRVVDLEMGQWGTWTFPAVTPSNGLFMTAINGSVWLQTTTPSVVYSVDDPAALSDAGLGAYTALIETGVLRPANPVPHGWGRLRSVTPNEIRKSTDAQVSVNVQVLADQNDRVLLNKTKITNPTDTALYPGGGDGVLEFRATVQRCAYFRVLMSITPAVFDVEGLDLWVANTGEKSPSNNRS